MEILYHKDLRNKDHRELLGYLPYVKLSLKEWLFVDIRLNERAAPKLTIDHVAEAVHTLFKKLEGKLYVCNDREILMIIRWGKNNPNSIVADNIGTALPKDGCQVYVHEPTLQGLAKLEILITYKKPETSTSLADVRATRRENIILIADDDMYMRLLAKKAMPQNYTIVEVADGNDVIEAYKKHIPDVVFLDIHLPNVEGTNLLQQLLAMDSKAYVIMLSADSSRENVKTTANNGARGFLTKPFTKERVQEYLNKCITIS
ncbi:MAG: response regulator [Alphaproteobacteria bacterium]|nr:response regulator [Alphaproteobacteria bacterium]